MLLTLTSLFLIFYFCHVSNNWTFKLKNQFVIFMKLLIFTHKLFKTRWRLIGVRIIRSKLLLKFLSLPSAYVGPLTDLLPLTAEPCQVSTWTSWVTREASLGTSVWQLPRNLSRCLGGPRWSIGWVTSNQSDHSQSDDCIWLKADWLADWLV